MRRIKIFARIGSIFLLNLIIKESIDLVLTPLIIIKLGYLASLLATTIIYSFTGIMSVKIYDFYKKDCLLIERLKRFQQDGDILDKKNGLIKLILRWSSKSNILKFLLSVKNPGLVVIYYRDGFYKYNGFTGKNIKIIFFLNLLLVNIYWNTTLYVGFSVWEFIKTIF